MSDSDRHEEYLLKQVQDLQSENANLKRLLSNQRGVSTTQARILSEAARIEKEMYEEGYRYVGWVIVQHEEGTTLSFRYAFATLYYDEEEGVMNHGRCEYPGEYLLVFTEHHGIHDYALDDLYGWWMLEEQHFPMTPKYAARLPIREKEQFPL